jgi:GTP-binding protein Era
LLIDAQRAREETRDLRQAIEVRQPKVLILNKIDLVPRENLLALTAQRTSCS